MHIYAYLLHVLSLNKKKLIEISKITAHLYLNVKKTPRIRFILKIKRIAHRVFIT